AIRLAASGVYAAGAVQPGEPQQARFHAGGATDRAAGGAETRPAGRCGVTGCLMTDELAIHVSGLAKSFGDRPAVRDLSIDVPVGSIYRFLGPNGRGKSDTIRMLCGLLPPDAGEGQCLGFDIRRDPAKIKAE